MSSLDLWLEESWNDQLALRLRLRACIHASTSPFQRIEVHDSLSLGRILCLGGQPVLSEAAEVAYNEGLAHSAVTSHPAPRRILVLGGGDGGIAREIARHPVVEHIDVVEIDAAVVEVARAHFPTCAAGLDDPRTHLIIDDAHRFLAEADGGYDVIIVDGAELHAPASDAVHRRPFCNLVTEALAPGGILAAPLGIPAINPAACRGPLALLAQACEQMRIFQIPSAHFPGLTLAAAWCGPQQELTAQHIPQGPCRFWTPTVHLALFALPPALAEELGL